MEQVNQEDHTKSQKSQVDQDSTDGNPNEEKRGQGSRDEKKDRSEKEQKPPGSDSDPSAQILDEIFRLN